MKINILENKPSELYKLTFREGLKCEICQYKARFSAVLKSHITKKHNPELLRKESIDMSLPMLHLTPSHTTERKMHNPPPSPHHVPLSISLPFFFPLLIVFLFPLHHHQLLPAPTLTVKIFLPTSLTESV